MNAIKMPKFKGLPLRYPLLTNSLKAFGDRPLIWLLPFFMLGLNRGWARPETSFNFLILAAALALISLVIFQKQARCGFLFLIPAMFFLGWGLMVQSLTKPDDPQHIINFTKEVGFEHPVIFSGVVLEGSGWRPGQSHRLILEAREIGRPGLNGWQSQQKVWGKVLVSVGGGGRVWVEPGDYVSLPIVLKEVHGFKNPGSADYDQLMAAQKIWVSGFVKSPKLITAWAGPDSKSWLSCWRRSALGFIQENTSEPVTGLLAAQLAGQRGAVELSTEETYRALGLSHLLSVSGLHLGVWYGVCFWLIRQIVRRFRFLASRANLFAGLLALVPALFYAALVGTESPVMRAAIMIAAVVLATASLKRVDPWNILALAAWALLLVEPYRLFTVSFQLSFVATAAMLAVFIPRPGVRKLAPPSTSLWNRQVDGQLLASLGRRLLGQPLPPSINRKEPGQFSFFHSAVLAALAGTLGTAPLVAHHFGRVALAGILANVLFTSLLSALVLIPGLLALALWPLNPGLAAWPLALAAGVQAGLLPVMEKMASWAGPGWLLPSPGLWFMAAWFIAGWVWLRTSSSWKTRLLATFVILGCGLAPGFIQGQGQRDVLKFTVLDVGQGSSIHINFPDGSQMLVDGGGTYNYDPGERLITPYLLRQGLSQLDVVALTHPDRDHLKGLVAVTKNFSPREIWDAPWPENYSSLYQSFLQAFPKAARQSLEDLAQGRKFGQAKVTLLWPPAGLAWPIQGLDSGWINDHGLVLKVEWGEVSFLITGDIGPKIEDALIDRWGVNLQSTVLMAPHHGGRASLTPRFLETVRPQWVVFSSGRDNSYGLPHPETLARVQEFGASIRRTDLEGAAVFQVRQIGSQTQLEVRSPGDFR